ncbi:CoA transferase [Kribbella sp.]|uniref:CoA transferase n=1 Tax=Kribbella sp. TaxID=1871183 RepID=UPI002D23E56A|nr:CoA transferase [Kribbella sp.]HZX06003.1 CoA transferase [Kribbella sp.]
MSTADVFLQNYRPGVAARLGVDRCTVQRGPPGRAACCGQLVQVNMLDAVVALQMQELSLHTVGGVPQTRSEEVHAHSYIRAPYGIFTTADGYISLAFANLPVLAEVLDAPQLAGLATERDGFARRDEIAAAVSTVLRRESTEHWMLKLRTSARPRGL